MCCDGSFFARITLRAEDVPRVTARGLPIVQGTHLAQPCAAHRGTSCAIYDDRPAACAAYRCNVLRDLEAGALDLAHAQEKVARVRQLMAAVQQALAAQSRGQALFEAAQAFFEAHDTAASRREHALLLLDMAELLAACRKDFGVSSSGSGEIDEVAGG